MIHDEFEPQVAPDCFSSWSISGSSRMCRPWIWVHCLLKRPLRRCCLPILLVLGVDEHSEDGFVIVGIHLEALVGESASNTLEWDESEIELGVVGGKSVAQCAKELCAPD